MSPKNCQPTLTFIESLTPLAELGIGSRACIRALVLDPRETDWLRALGIAEGESVLLIRRALFGGPLHVRTSSGGEFAIDRTLARAIHVEHEAPGAAPSRAAAAPAR